jgi:arylsulfatase A-like enzyme
MKKKNSFYILPFIVLTLTVIVFSPVILRGSQRHNVILIVSDALRADVLGCYGGDVKTPNIDWLASKGVLFKNAYATAPCTLPSSVSMLTGNYSMTYGIYNLEKKKGFVKKFIFYVNDSETLLAKVLKQDGYDVFMEVENKIAQRSNNTQGFTKFRRFSRMKKEEIAFVENSIGIKRPAKERPPLLSNNYHRLYDLLYYILTVPRQRNFFLLKWFMDPHSPYNPPDAYREKIVFDQTKLPKPESFYRTSRRNLKEFPDYVKYVYFKKLYKAEVASVDERVGFIIKALKKRGLLDKTIFVFTSDHGELFGEHGRIGHSGTFYEQVVKVPLIIMGPGIPMGKTEKSCVSHLDLMPTLKELLGLKYEENMQGTSYSRLFNGGAPGPCIQYFDMIANNIMVTPGSDALLIDNYKLTVKKKVKSDGYKIQLYNLNLDPGEIHDTAAQNPSILKKMFKKIVEFRKENQRRLKLNMAKIDKKPIDLDEERKKTMEQLKSLGYIK